jgi:hypothetical protein
MRYLMGANRRLGLCCRTLSKPHKTQPTKTMPLAGGVRHDARGNAVWQWATETARHAVASTSQLLRRLDVSSLSLQDDESPPGSPTTPARPARKAQGGFNPYDGAAMPAAPAVKKRPAPQAPARSSWWRRLFDRR